MILYAFAVLTLIIGIYVIAKGEVALSSKRSARGTKSRVIGGLVCVMIRV